MKTKQNRQPTAVYSGVILILSGGRGRTNPDPKPTRNWRETWLRRFRSFFSIAPIWVDCDLRIADHVFASSHYQWKPCEVVFCRVRTNHTRGIYRGYYPTNNCCKFCRTFIPVPGTSGSSVRPWPQYPRYRYSMFCTRPELL